MKSMKQHSERRRKQRPIGDEENPSRFDEEPDGGSPPSHGMPDSDSEDYPSQLDELDRDYDLESTDECR